VEAVGAGADGGFASDVEVVEVHIVNLEVLVSWSDDTVRESACSNAVGVD